jgi:hypothetical protein
VLGAAWGRRHDGTRPAGGPGLEPWIVVRVGGTSGPGTVTVAGTARQWSPAGAAQSLVSKVTLLRISFKSFWCPRSSSCFRPVVATGSGWVT